MPYVEPSWRNENMRLKRISRLLCLVGLHHWLKSSRTREKLMCVVCNKTTKLWHERMKKHFQ